MNKILQKTKFLFVLIPLIYLTTTGSECEKLLTGSINEQLIGTWQMTRIEGALQDICYNERVTFQSDGIALLVCPGGTQISRNYSATSTTLTYTSSGVEYDITSVTSSELRLRGRNVSRNLTYVKVISTDAPVLGNDVKSGSKNSSDK